MIRPPPIFTRTDTLVPDTTLVRSTQRSDYGVRTPRVCDFRSAERGYQKGGAAALGGNGRYGPIFDSRAPGNVALGREENVSKPRLVFGGIVSPDGYPDFVFYTAVCHRPRNRVERPCDGAAGGWQDYQAKRELNRAGAHAIYTTQRKKIE